MPAPDTGYTGPLQHQAYNILPPRDSEVVIPRTGILTSQWYWFFTRIWQFLGQSFSSWPNPSYVAGTDIYSAETGQFVGKAITSNLVGAPAQPQTLNTSPFTFTATSLGMLAVYGGEVQFSRDGGLTYYPAGLTGGPIFMLSKDMVQITWFSNQPPIVTWFPTATT